MSIELATRPEPTNDTAVDDAVQAERAVIGALLMLGGTAQREILTQFDNHDFTDPACRWIITPLRTMILSGHPCDSVTFAAWLQHRGMTPKADSRRNLRLMLFDWTRDVPNLASALWYAAVVKENGCRRRTGEAMQRIGNAADAAYGADLDELRALVISEFCQALTALDNARVIFDD